LPGRSSVLRIPRTDLLAIAVDTRRLITQNLYSGFRLFWLLWDFSPTILFPETIEIRRDLLDEDEVTKHSDRAKYRPELGPESGFLNDHARQYTCNDVNQPGKSQPQESDRVIQLNLTAGNLERWVEERLEDAEREHRSQEREGVTTGMF
jgi:hypothetical protein